MLTPEQHKEIYNDVKEIKKVLIGNEKYQQKGLIERVSDNEKYIQKDKKLKWIGIGVAAAIGWIVKEFKTINWF